MKRYLRTLGFLVFIISILGGYAQAQQPLTSPPEYLGYELGERWTPHHKVLGYVRHVAEQSALAKLEQYGTTNEGRELVMLTVASEENMNRLQEIQTNNLKRAGLLEGTASEHNPAIVWLSYNVHGNETSSSEAAMKTLYELVRPDNAESKEWLRNTVVIMDPMLNPDGRDRYVNWYNQTVGSQFNANGESREHHEPWPGGRTNHYYFDLNRDWAWLTQKESRQRLEAYQRWMPHIHVDFHEQGYNSPYYFAPAARPFHNAITDWQRNFQHTIGKNHAKYFDQNNWLYFTREVFDLFYPSYGDTYPTFNGAIGMTYEQAGGGYSGLGIRKPEGDTLTLNDRLTHHFTTGISTIEVASQSADQIVNEFARFYREGAEDPAGEYKTFVIKGNNNTDKLRALFNLLDHHDIEYSRAADSHNVNGYNYRTGNTERVRIDDNDYLVSVYQPKSVMARVLFEPRPELTDSATYDITAWEQHYAYGLEGFALTDRIEGEETSLPEVEADNSTSGSPYAYLAGWKDLSDVRLLSDLLKEGIVVRSARQEFEIDGRSYDAGTLIITRNGNEKLGSEFDRIVQDAATAHGQQLYPVATGMVTSGADFGSSSVRYLKAPKVALLSGEHTRSYMVGEIWHYFDQQIDYPVTLIGTDYFSEIDLSKYDVLILPSGQYSKVLTEERLKEVRKWVSDGGTMIAVQGANRFLAGKEGFSLKEKEMEETEEDEEDKLRTFNQRRQDRVSENNPGSVFRVSMDNSHPLGYGYDTSYFSLKLDSDAYAYLDEGWNVGVVREDAHMSGFIGYKAKDKLKNTLTFGVENIGQGSVVYMVDNPLFRAFWYNGKLLFGNAVFMVGNQ